MLRSTLDTYCTFRRDDRQSSNLAFSASALHEKRFRACYHTSQVRLLEADNKTEPDTLERWRGEREKAERESAKANVAYVTVREIVKSFQHVPAEEDEEAGGEGIRQQSGEAVAA